MDLQFICKQTCHAAEAAGLFIQKERQSFSFEQVETKSFNQLVSYVDKTSEEMLVHSLSNILPEAGFITEEKTISSDEKEWMWVIDPLDGTTNFIHDLPVYSVSIGLLQNGKPKMGVVYEPNRKEMFYAWKDGGAYLNGKPINVKQNSELGKSLMATGFPYYDFKIMPQYLETLSELMKTTQGMRRMGSAAVDLAYTACGRFDGFFEYGLSPWDVAGGIVLIEEAGGIVKDFSGGDDMTFGRTILACSSAIYPEFSSVIKKHFTSY
ncbi:MAG: inositol monophosphatase family protein [Bacteroidia bacterium]